MINLPILFDFGISQEDPLTEQILLDIFAIAFHPSVYKKRGLQEQALLHADGDTGLRFFQKFGGFCAATPARQNYFLQYFLTGKCLFPRTYT